VTTKGATVQVTQGTSQVTSKEAAAQGAAVQVAVCKLCGEPLTEKKIKAKTRFCDGCMDKRLGVIVNRDIGNEWAVGWHPLGDGNFQRLAHNS